MTLRSLRARHLLAAALLVGAVAVLAVQLMHPSPIVVSVDGSTTEVGELSGVFTYRDVAIIGLAAALIGATSTYLILEQSDTTVETSGTPGPTVADGAGEQDVDDLLEARREEWATVADRLRANERTVYETVLDADGVIEQRTIVEETDLSKATVSRMLDSLESKQLLERKRRGMGNVVILQ